MIWRRDQLKNPCALWHCDREAKWFENDTQLCGIHYRAAEKRVANKERWSREADARRSHRAVMEQLCAEPELARFNFQVTSVDNPVFGIAEGDLRALLAHLRGQS